MTDQMKETLAIAVVIGITTIIFLLPPKEGHRLEGGLGDDLDEKRVDPLELAMGIKVEMEHTDDRAIAKEIALDHLAEDPRYYSKLKKMEGA